MTKPGRALLRASELTAEQWRILGRACLVLTIVSVTVAVAPFRRAIRLGSIALRRRSPPIAIGDALWAVEAAARRIPLRTKCIEQGITLQRLLRSGGVDARLHYGARHAPGDGALEAHVWVTVTGQPVIGGEIASEFAEVASYP